MYLYLKFYFICLTNTQVLQTTQAVGQPVFLLFPASPNFTAGFDEPHAHHNNLGVHRLFCRSINFLLSVARQAPETIAHVNHPPKSETMT